MTTFVLGYLIAVNVLTFMLTGWDKHCARRGRRRIPEKTLLLTAACGGAAAMLLGMRLFHHKTRKPKFAYGVPCLLLIHIALLAGWLYLRLR